MHKKTQAHSSNRVLARILAEDLRQIRGGVLNQDPCGCPDEPAPATPTITVNPTDITNVGGDGD